MPGRVIEVLTRGAMLSRDRGFMTIRRKDQETAQISLSDIAAVILGPGVEVSTNLLLALHEYGASITVAGQNYHPAALFWPMPDHTEHCHRLDLQIASSVPSQKRLWQHVVQTKIIKQSEVLLRHFNSDEGLAAMSERVHSGDPDNVEAQAARRYWPSLMGPDFRRNHEPTDDTDPNASLNYGYAVMRAAMARAISASGLHPALGIHHTNQANPFRLVDDLMEPYRPLVDDVVARLNKAAGGFSLDHETKRILAGLLDMDLKSRDGDNSPVSVTMLRVAQSYVASLESGKMELVYPLAAADSHGHS